MELKKFLPLLGIFSFLSFGQSVELPEPYKDLIKGILPRGVDVKISNFGGNYEAEIKRETSNGISVENVSSDDFISLYTELYEDFVQRKPIEVSIKVETAKGTIPYNPFFELWDNQNHIKVLKFSRLKPGCKPPIIEIKANGVAGIRIFVGFEEIKEKLFEGGFKKPSYYCF
jgi:hypothetical protein